MSSPPSAGSSSSSNSDAEMEEIKSSESESEQKAEQTSKKQELIKYQVGRKVPLSVLQTICITYVHCSTVIHESSIHQLITAILIFTRLS